MTSKNDEPPTVRAWIRLRMSSGDAHYEAGLVDGARILQVFGDLATELAIRTENDEGLFRAYDSVEFLAPIHSGDFIEAEAQIVSAGHSSRRITFQAHKQITYQDGANGKIPVELEEPQLVARATGTIVVPVGKERHAEAA